MTIRSALLPTNLNSLYIIPHHNEHGLAPGPHSGPTYFSLSACPPLYGTSLASESMLLSYPLLLDGGLSNELERQGCSLNHKLWSAHLLDSNPEALVLAHLSYLESGAQCIITSSYRATIPGFMALGHDKPAARALILKSVEVAKEARSRFLSRNQHASRPFIAASIGPYGASLADGSEYRGDYALTDQELTDFHEARIHLLADSPADLLACETIPSFREAMALYKILERTNKPAWVSFSCKDGKHKIGWIEPVKQEIQGWSVHVDPQLLGGDHEEEGRRALSMLANHLERIAILVPEKQPADLRRMEIWIEREHPELNSMQYHPGAEWLIERGYDPRLAKKVHKEYFAEATEAYFYRNDFYPFVRAELLKHDPAGHAEMVRIWQK